MLSRGKRLLAKLNYWRTFIVYLCVLASPQKKLIEIRYERNDIAFERNMFRVRGDTVEIFPAYSNDKRK